MYLEFKKEPVLPVIEYGDVIIMSDGDSVLIVRDADGEDFRGIILNKYASTGWEESIENLLKNLEQQGRRTVHRVIKASNLKLVEV